MLRLCHIGHSVSFNLNSTNNMFYFLFLFALVGAGYCQDEEPVAVAEVEANKVALLGSGVGGKGTPFSIYGQGSWHAAPNVCTINNKKLVKIDTAEKNEDVEYFLKRHAATLGPFWTQGNRLYDGTTWAFLDQEPMKYFNWGDGSSYHNEKCIVILKNGKWESHPCNSLRHVLCED